jgi:hypothetical protein
VSVCLQILMLSGHTALFLYLHLAGCCPTMTVKYAMLHFIDNIFIRHNESCACCRTFLTFRVRIVCELTFIPLLLWSLWTAVTSLSSSGVRTRIDFVLNKAMINDPT